MPPLVSEKRNPPFGVAPVDTDPRFSPDFTRDDVDVLLPGGRIWEQAHANLGEPTIRAATMDPDSATDWEHNAGFGHIIKPKYESLWGYKAALRKNADMQFDPHTFGLFDGIVARETGLDAKGHAKASAFNPNDEFYHNYAPLRRNLAILRDYLLVHYPPTGKDAQHNIATVQEMAKKIGKAMNDPSTKPMFITRWLRTMKNLATGQPLAEPDTGTFIQLANTPDRGISYMYKFLYDQQNNPSFSNAVSFSSTAPRNWKLKPLEESPFSGENVVLYSRAYRMERIVESFDTVVGHLHSVDTLQEKDRQISVEEAHKILKNLRINLATGRDEQMIENLDPKILESQLMLKAALCYRGLTAELARFDPELLNNPKLGHAETMETLEKIDYRLKLEQQRILTEDGHMDSAAAMARMVSETPNKYKTDEPIAELLQRLDDGITRASELEKSVHASQANFKKTSEQISQQAELQEFVRKGKDTMSAPKIGAISDPSLVQEAAALNQHEPERKKVDPNSGQGLNGGK